MQECGELWSLKCPEYTCHYLTDRANSLRENKCPQGSMKERKQAQKIFRLGLICRINCCFDPWLCCLMNVSFYCIVFIMYWREFIWYVNWYNWMFLHLHDYHLKHASRIPIILWKNIKHRKCWSNLWFCKKEIFCKRHWSLYTLQLPLFVSTFEWTRGFLKQKHIAMDEGWP